jgi:hypothetical protein
MRLPMRAEHGSSGLGVQQIGSPVDHDRAYPLRYFGLQDLDGSLVQLLLTRFDRNELSELNWQRIRGSREIVALQLTTNSGQRCVQ